MGRLFASLFGAVAFLVVVLRSWTEGWAIEPTLQQACLALVIFSLLGGWVGWTADTAICQAVQTQLDAALGPAAAAQSESSPTPPR